MWYLYLDESGDLGFDFVNKKPSNYFTVTILAVSGPENNKLLLKAVKKTLNRKLNPKNKRTRIVEELKATKTTIEIKKYFYEQVKDLKFALYSISLNKVRIYEKLRKNKDKVYNYIARLVCDKIPFEKAGLRIYLIIDRSKSKPEIKEFNNYIKGRLESRIDRKCPFDIYHDVSKENYGLQAVDMFCWGIFQVFERKNKEWYDVFAKEKIKYNKRYL